ncbi:DUF2802 domain-containing protein [Algicola sagamiensis]|uniref:DUF2802 domain-containing protein n=1 Tax=Algicola sagamiensis TaxID=163869 RepID=UPI00146A348C|nr:DUF2802 domain-containing protein [Algicola sagamiensis]
MKQKKMCVNLTKQLQENQEYVVQLTKKDRILASEIGEMRAGILGLGKRVAELESMTQQVSTRQEEIAASDPDSRLYSRAAKLIEKGADVQEIMQECDLPRAEAELMVSLHRK